MILTIILISVALAMDAFTVSITGGALKKKVTQIDYLKTGLTFGIFQAMMPFIGYLFSSAIISSIESVDHWIALALLSIIGIKLIYEGTRKNKKEIDLFDNKSLLVLGIATSIDALAVGLSISTLGLPLFFTIFSIGLTAFAFSCLGVMVGKSLGSLVKNAAPIIGGIILIGIGIKILFEHL